jgi:hypothetical protein
MRNFTQFLESFILKGNYSGKHGRFNGFNDMMYVLDNWAEEGRIHGPGQTAEQFCRRASAKLNSPTYEGSEDYKLGVLDAINVWFKKKNKM